jgi:hypothetical protein
MSARVTAPWMTWCLTMLGSAWCDMRSILVVPSFWASSTKASSLGQKTVMGPAPVRRPSQLVCVDRAGGDGVSVSILQEQTVRKTSCVEVRTDVRG